MDGSAKIESYRDLLVWQKAVDLAVATYRATKDYPREEIYGLTSQTRRAAASVAANIAEGYGRDSAGAYVQFLKTAQGSLKEFETHIIIASRVGILAPEHAQSMLLYAEEVGRMLRSLIRSIQNTTGDRQ